MIDVHRFETLTERKSARRLLAIHGLRAMMRLKWGTQGPLALACFQLLLVYVLRVCFRSSMCNSGYRLAICCVTTEILEFRLA